MNWLKKYLADFPTHQATVFVALTAIALLTIVVVVRLALGLIFPDGYDTYIWMLAALCGVTGAWGVGKRLTDYDYAAIKAGTVQPTQVNVASPSNVTVSPPATTDQDKP
jgi:hypothetical protein